MTSFAASSLATSTPGLTAVAVTVGIMGVAALHGAATRIQGHYKRTVADKKRLAKKERSRKSIEDLRKRLERDPMPSAEVEHITGLDITTLVSNLKSGILTPPAVLKAYQTKALEVHGRTNCLIEVITEAEAWAHDLSMGPKKGLLYGVPISVKEDIALQGYDSTMGCVDLADKPAKDDAAIIKVLKMQGAIPFVRTNIPQFCMSFEPGNPIFGKVFHPMDPEHIPGGSSSGEAALTGAGGSIIGIGSDLAGSVRVPAHFTGVCGFKSTSQRMSNVGCLEGYTNYEQNELGPVFGPLAANVENIAMLYKALWDGSSLTTLDPISVPLPFNQEVYTSTQRLRIGYYTEDGVFPIFPGCARAVHEAKAVLEELGHELVPWRIPDMARARELLFAVCLADGGDLQRQLLKYDKTDPTIAPLIPDDPPLIGLRRLLGKVIQPWIPNLGRSLQALEGEPDLPSFFYLVSEVREYVVHVTQEWNKAGLDALLCPPFPMPAPKFGNADLCMDAGAYCMTYNALNFPCGIVPVTQVTSTDIDNLKDYPEDDPLYARAKKVMAETLGMPMGVMLAATRYNDETCLRLMKEIEARKQSHLHS